MSRRALEESEGSARPGAVFVAPPSQREAAVTATSRKSARNAESADFALAMGRGDQSWSQRAAPEDEDRRTSPLANKLSGKKNAPQTVSSRPAGCTTAEIFKAAKQRVEISGARSRHFRHLFDAQREKANALHATGLDCGRKPVAGHHVNLESQFASGVKGTGVKLRSRIGSTEDVSYWVHKDAVAQQAGLPFRHASESRRFGDYGVIGKEYYDCSQEFLFMGTLLSHAQTSTSGGGGGGGAAGTSASACDAITLLINSEHLFYVDTTAANLAALARGGNVGEAADGVIPICRLADIEAVLVHTIPSVGLKAQSTGNKAPDTFSIVYKPCLLNRKETLEMDAYKMHRSHAEHDTIFSPILPFRKDFLFEKAPLARKSEPGDSAGYAPKMRHALGAYNVGAGGGSTSVSSSSRGGKFHAAGEKRFLHKTVQKQLAKAAKISNGKKFRTGRFNELRQVAGRDRETGRPKVLFEFTLPASMDRVPWRKQNLLGTEVRHSSLKAMGITSQTTTRGAGGAAAPASTSRPGRGVKKVQIEVPVARKTADVRLPGRGTGSVESMPLPGGLAEPGTDGNDRAPTPPCSDSLPTSFDAAGLQDGSQPQAQIAGSSRVTGGTQQDEDEVPQVSRGQEADAGVDQRAEDVNKEGEHQEVLPRQPYLYFPTEQDPRSGGRAGDAEGPRPSVPAIQVLTRPTMLRPPSSSADVEEDAVMEGRPSEKDEGVSQQQQKRAAAEEDKNADLRHRLVLSVLPNLSMGSWDADLSVKKITYNKLVQSGNPLDDHTPPDFTVSVLNYDWTLKNSNKEREAHRKRAEGHGSSTGSSQHPQQQQSHHNSHYSQISRHSARQLTALRHIYRNARQVRDVSHWLRVFKQFGVRIEPARDSHTIHMIHRTIAIQRKFAAAEMRLLEKRLAKFTVLYSGWLYALNRAEIGYYVLDSHGLTLYSDSSRSLPLARYRICDVLSIRKVDEEKMRRRGKWMRKRIEEAFERRVLRDELDLSQVLEQLGSAVSLRDLVENVLDWEEKLMLLLQGRLSPAAVRVLRALHVDRHLLSGGLGMGNHKKRRDGEGGEGGPERKAFAVPFGQGGISDFKKRLDAKVDVYKLLAGGIFTARKNKSFCSSKSRLRKKLHSALVLHSKHLPKQYTGAMSFMKRKDDMKQMFIKCRVRLHHQQDQFFDELHGGASTSKSGPGAARTKSQLFRSKFARFAIPRRSRLQIRLPPVDTERAFSQDKWHGFDPVIEGKRVFYAPLPEIKNLCALVAADAEKRDMFYDTIIGSGLHATPSQYGDGKRHKNAFFYDANQFGGMLWRNLLDCGLDEYMGRTIANRLVLGVQKIAKALELEERADFSYLFRRKSFVNALLPTLEAAEGMKVKDVGAGTAHLVGKSPERRMAMARSLEKMRESAAAGSLLKPVEAAPGLRDLRQKKRGMQLLGLEDKNAQKVLQDRHNAEFREKVYNLKNGILRQLHHEEGDIHSNFDSDSTLSSGSDIDDVDVDDESGPKMRLSGGITVFNSPSEDMVARRSQRYGGGSLAGSASLPQPHGILKAGSAATAAQQMKNPGKKKKKKIDLRKLFKDPTAQRWKMECLDIELRQESWANTFCVRALDPRAPHDPPHRLYFKVPTHDEIVEHVESQQTPELGIPSSAEEDESGDENSSMTHSEEGGRGNAALKAGVAGARTGGKRPDFGTTQIKPTIQRQQPGVEGAHALEAGAGGSPSSSATPVKPKAGRGPPPSAAPSQHQHQTDPSRSRHGMDWFDISPDQIENEFVLRNQEDRWLTSLRWVDSMKLAHCFFRMVTANKLSAANCSRRLCANRMPSLIQGFLTIRMPMYAEEGKKYVVLHPAMGLLWYKDKQAYEHGKCQGNINLRVRRTSLYGGVDVADRIAMWTAPQKEQSRRRVAFSSSGGSSLAGGSVAAGGGGQADLLLGGGAAAPASSRDPTAWQQVGATATDSSYSGTDGSEDDDDEIVYSDSEDDREDGLLSPSPPPGEDVHVENLLKSGEKFPSSAASASEKRKQSKKSRHSSQKSRASSDKQALKALETVQQLEHHPDGFTMHDLHELERRGNKKEHVLQLGEEKARAIRRRTTNDYIGGVGGGSVQQTAPGAKKNPISQCMSGLFGRRPGNKYAGRKIAIVAGRGKHQAAFDVVPGREDQGQEATRVISKGSPRGADFSPEAKTGTSAAKVLDSPTSAKLYYSEGDEDGSSSYAASDIEDAVDALNLGDQDPVARFRPGFAATLEGRSSVLVGGQTEHGGHGVHLVEDSDGITHLQHDEKTEVDANLQQKFIANAREMYLLKWGYVEQAVFLKNPNQGAVFYVSVSSVEEEETERRMREEDAAEIAASRENAVGASTSSSPEDHVGGKSKLQSKRKKSRRPKPRVVPGFILTAERKHGGFKEWADRLSLTYGVPFSFYTDRFSTSDYDVFKTFQDGHASTSSANRDPTDYSDLPGPQGSDEQDSDAFLSRVSATLDMLRQDTNAHFGPEHAVGGLIPYQPSPLRTQRENTLKAAHDAKVKRIFLEQQLRRVKAGKLQAVDTQLLASMDVDEVLRNSEVTTIARDALTEPRQTRLQKWCKLADPAQAVDWPDEVPTCEVEGHETEAGRMLTNDQSSIGLPADSRRDGVKLRLHGEEAEMALHRPVRVAATAGRYALKLGKYTVMSRKAYGRQCNRVQAENANPMRQEYHKPVVHDEDVRILYAGRLFQRNHSVWAHFCSAAEPVLRRLDRVAAFEKDLEWDYSRSDPSLLSPYQHGKKMRAALAAAKAMKGDGNKKSAEAEGGTSSKAKGADSKDSHPENKGKEAPRTKAPARTSQNPALAPSTIENNQNSSRGGGYEPHHPIDIHAEAAYLRDDFDFDGFATEAQLALRSKTPVHLSQLHWSFQMNRSLFHVFPDGDDQHRFRFFNAHIGKETNARSCNVKAAIVAGRSHRSGHGAHSSLTNKFRSPVSHGAFASAEELLLREMIRRGAAGAASSSTGIKTGTSASTSGDARGMLSVQAKKQTSIIAARPNAVYHTALSKADEKLDAEAVEAVHRMVSQNATFPASFYSCYTQQEHDYMHSADNCLHDFDEQDYLTAVAHFERAECLLKQQFATIVATAHADALALQKTAALHSTHTHHGFAGASGAEVAALKGAGACQGAEHDYVSKGRHAQAALVAGPLLNQSARLPTIPNEPAKLLASQYTTADQQGNATNRRYFELVAKRLGIHHEEVHLAVYHGDIRKFGLEVPKAIEHVKVKDIVRIEAVRKVRKHSLSWNVLRCLSRLVSTATARAPANPVAAHLASAQVNEIARLLEEDAVEADGDGGGGLAAGNTQKADEPNAKTSGTPGRVMGLRPADLRQMNGAKTTCTSSPMRVELEIYEISSLVLPTLLRLVKASTRSTSSVDASARSLMVIVLTSEGRIFKTPLLGGYGLRAPAKSSYGGWGGQCRGATVLVEFEHAKTTFEVFLATRMVPKSAAAHSAEGAPAAYSVAEILGGGPGGVGLRLDLRSYILENAIASSQKPVSFEELANRRGRLGECAHIFNGGGELPSGGSLSLRFDVEKLFYFLMGASSEKVAASAATGRAIASGENEVEVLAAGTAENAEKSNARLVRGPGHATNEKMKAAVGKLPTHTRLECGLHWHNVQVNVQNRGRTHFLRQLLNASRGAVVTKGPGEKLSNVSFLRALARLSDCLQAGAHHGGEEQNAPGGATSAESRASQVQLYYPEAGASLYEVSRSSSYSVAPSDEDGAQAAVDANALAVPLPGPRLGAGIEDDVAEFLLLEQLLHEDEERRQSPVLEDAAEEDEAAAPAQFLFMGEEGDGGDHDASAGGLSASNDINAHNTQENLLGHTKKFEPGSHRSNQRLTIRPEDSATSSDSDVMDVGDEGQVTVDTRARATFAVAPELSDDKDAATRARFAPAPRGGAEAARERLPKSAIAASNNKVGQNATVNRVVNKRNGDRRPLRNTVIEVDESRASAAEKGEGALPDEDGDFEQYSEEGSSPFLSSGRKKLRVARPREHAPDPQREREEAHRNFRMGKEHLAHRDTHHERSISDFVERTRSVDPRVRFVRGIMDSDVSKVVRSYQDAVIHSKERTGRKMWSTSQRQEYDVRNMALGFGELMGPRVLEQLEQRSLQDKYNRYHLRSGSAGSEEDEDDSENEAGDDDGEELSAEDAGTVSQTSDEELHLTDPTAAVPLYRTAHQARATAHHEAVRRSRVSGKLTARQRELIRDRIHELAKNGVLNQLPVTHLVDPARATDARHRKRLGWYVQDGHEVWSGREQFRNEVADRIRREDKSKEGTSNNLRSPRAAAAVLAMYSASLQHLNSPGHVVAPSEFAGNWLLDEREQSQRQQNMIKTQLLQSAGNLRFPGGGVGDQRDNSGAIAKNHMKNTGREEAKRLAKQIARLVESDFDLVELIIVIGAPVAGKKERVMGFVGPKLKEWLANLQKHSKRTPVVDKFIVPVMSGDKLGTAVAGGGSGPGATTTSTAGAGNASARGGAAGTEGEGQDSAPAN